jgi:hypothetical protein
MGATMPLSFGTSHLLSAASSGDVETISLLIKNAGLNVRLLHDKVKSIQTETEYLCRKECMILITEELFIMPL